MLYKWKPFTISADLVSKLHDFLKVAHLISYCNEDSALVYGAFVLSLSGPLLNIIHSFTLSSFFLFCQLTLHNTGKKKPEKNIKSHPALYFFSNIYFVVLCCSVFSSESCGNHVLTHLSGSFISVGLVVVSLGGVCSTEALYLELVWHISLNSFL